MTALSFASSFGDHAVLQQAPAQAVVWGFAPAALGVTLTLAGGGLSSKLWGTARRKPSLLRFSQSCP